MFARWLRGCLSQIRSWLLAPFRTPKADPDPQPRVDAPTRVTIREPREPARVVRRTAPRPARVSAAKAAPASDPQPAPKPDLDVDIEPEAVAALAPEAEPVPAGPVRWSYCEACGHVYRVGSRPARTGARRPRRGCDRPRSSPRARPAAAMAH